LDYFYFGVIKYKEEYYNNIFPKAILKLVDETEKKKRYFRGRILNLKDSFDMIKTFDAFENEKVMYKEWKVINKFKVIERIQLLLLSKDNLKN